MHAAFARKLFGAEEMALEFEYKRFGIQVGSTADQLTKIINAANSIYGDYGRGALELPPGPITIDGPIPGKTNFTYRGQGRNATRVIQMQDAPIFNFDTAVFGAGMGRCGIIDCGMTYDETNPNFNTWTSDAVVFASSVAGAVERTIFMPLLHNLTISAAPRDGVALLVNGGAYIAEAEFSYIEIVRPGRHGYRESQGVADTHATKIYIAGDTSNTRSTGYGFFLQGGSGRFDHPHSVAMGTNDGNGDYGGGSFRVDCNFTEFSNAHSDRPAGHGFVVGSYDGVNSRVGNVFKGCLGFNAGAFYPGYNPTVNAAYNWKVGRVTYHEWHGGRAGELGTGAVPGTNGYGFGFEGTVTQARIFGMAVHGNNIVGLSATSNVPDGAVKTYGTMLGSNTADYANPAKFVVA